MKHATIRFCTQEPNYSDLPSKEYNWFSIYGKATKVLPDDAPKPLEKPITLTYYVDANLFHDALTGRPVTGIFYMINATLNEWYSKKQTIAETATYGSEFVTACICVEQVINLHSTLRYLEILVNDRNYMFGDNESVVNSSSIPHT